MSTSIVSNQRTTIHIGLLKTASTTLQAGFAANPRLTYVDYRLVESLRAVAASAAETGQPLPAQVPVGHLPSILRGSDKPVVISDERFSGIPHYSYQVKSGAVTRAFQTHCARLLHAVAPQSRIVIVLREPRAWLLSYYKQFVKFGEHRRIKPYCRAHHDHLIQSYDVDFLTDLYAGLFGAGNVVVLPFEMLRKDSDRFLEIFSDAVGVPIMLPESANKGIEDGLIEHIRQLNAVRRFLARQARWNDAYARQTSLLFFDVVEGALTDRERTQKILKRALPSARLDVEPPTDMLEDMRHAVRRTLETNPLFAPFRDLYAGRF